MNLSFFACQVIYLAHFGAPMPDSMTFVAAARTVRAEVPSTTFARMVRTAESVKHDLSVTTDDAARALRAIELGA